MLIHSGSFPKGVIPGCNTKTLDFLIEPPQAPEPEVEAEAEAEPEAEAEEEDPIAQARQKGRGGGTQNPSGRPIFFGRKRKLLVGLVLKSRGTCKPRKEAEPKPQFSLGQTLVSLTDVWRAMANLSPKKVAVKPKQGSTF